MSLQVDTALIQKFSADAYHLAQQGESRLRGAVMIETLRAEVGYFDQIGAVDPIQITSRHQDTVYTEVPHARRRLTMDDWANSEIFDSFDRFRMAFDADSKYIQAFAKGMGRQMDRTILSAFFASAATGKSGGTSVAFPSGQQIAVDYVETGSTTNSALTVAKLRKARQLLMDAEAGNEEDLYVAVTQNDITQLMRDTTVISNDFYKDQINKVADGTVSRFAGFNLIRLPASIIPVDGSSNRRLPAWSKSGMLFAEPEGPEINVGKDPSKNFNWRVHMKATFGATRMEEVKVVEIKSHPTALV